MTSSPESAMTGALAASTVATATDDVGRRRFARAWTAGSAIAAAVFGWLVTAGTGDFFRHQRLFDDFYEAQANAILHGNLAIPRLTLGFEGIVHDGKTYMYFPPVPAVLRIPVVAFTHALDGRLGAAYLLLAFVLAMAGAGVFVWRVRRLLRPGPVSRGEAWATGALALLLGVGSPALFMGSRAWVYHESALWGIAFAICAYDQIVAFVTSPSGRRLARAGAFGGASLLSRPPIGAGPIAAIALVLAAVVAVRLRPRWQERLRPLGADNVLARADRWLAPLVSVFAIPVVVYVVINYAKFGTLLTVPYDQQVQNLFDPTRARTLAANYNSLFNPRAVPTQVFQYLRPDGVSFQSFFPWVVFPTSVPHVVGDVVFDKLDHTSSVTATMPAFLVLGVVGGVGVVRRPALAPLRTAVIGAIVVLPVSLSVVYVTERYTGDLLPLLVLLVVPGFHLAYGWLAASHAARGAARVWCRVAVVGLAILVLWGCFATFALALEYQRVLAPFVPDDSRRSYIQFQSDVAEWIGTEPLPVGRGRELPRPAHPNQLFVVGDCAGLYTPDGRQWAGVERTNRTGQFRLRIRFVAGAPGFTEPVLVSGRGSGRRVIGMRMLGDGRGVFTYSKGGRETGVGIPFDVGGGPREFDVLMDRRLHEMHVILDGRPLLGVTYDGRSDHFTVGRDPDATDRTLQGSITSLPVRATLCPKVLSRAR